MSGDGDDILPPSSPLDSELKRISPSIPTIVVDNDTQPINVLELNPQNRRKTGRPSGYTQAIADEVCSLLSNGKTLRQICELEGMPDRTTIFRWLCADQRFCNAYAQARELHCDWWFDELQRMVVDCDDPFQANLLRVQIDTIKWRVSRMSARYRDKSSGIAADGDMAGLPGPGTGAVDVASLATDDRDALRQLLLKAKKA